jgi:copper chaperone CopZ
MSTTYDVTGMTCAHCAAAVTSEIQTIPGVTGVEVDVETGQVVVHGEGVSDDAVAAAVDEAGYAVR